MDISLLCISHDLHTFLVSTMYINDARYGSSQPGHHDADPTPYWTQRPLSSIHIFSLAMAPIPGMPRTFCSGIWYRFACLCRLTMSQKSQP
jgi:hypothetical protein